MKAQEQSEKNPKGTIEKQTEKSEGNKMEDLEQEAASTSVLIHKQAAG